MEVFQEEGEIMLHSKRNNGKLFGYVINGALKTKNDTQKEEPDFQRVGICGILNYLNSTNPNKKYYGLMR